MMERKKRKWFSGWAAIVAGGVLLVMLILGSGRAPAHTAVVATEAGYLPVVLNEQPPTPTPTPTRVPSDVDAAVRVDPPFGGINGSTYDQGAFQISNQSANGMQIERVRFDLRTAVLPDLVFDPDGDAGDHIHKDISVDEEDGAFYTGRSYDAPRGGGYQVVELTFGEFLVGGEFAFSVDVDPNSIRGSSAPGPNESGSISGLEMVGTTVTVTFRDGPTLTQQLYRLPNSLKGSEARIRRGIPGAPGVAVLSAPPPPAAVSEAAQTVRVSGPAGRPVSVLVVEGGLFTEGVPDGGYDIDPFEANTALAVREYATFVGSDGTVDVPITLSRSQTEGGLNHIVAVFSDGYGLSGRVSAPIVLALDN